MSPPTLSSKNTPVLSPARHFKPHLQALARLRTSLGRDLDNGLCLDRNERAVPFPKPVMDAIRRRITSATLTYYPEPAALYEKLGKWLKVSADCVYITNGITEGIRVLYETLTSPGSEIVIVDPTYPMYRVYSKIYQVEHKAVGFNDDLTLRAGRFDELINERTVFVCIPNSNLPIENCMSLAELRRLAETCKERGAFLVVDEAYGLFGAESAAGLVKEFENVIVMQTYSKAFGMAGVRLGFMVSQAANIEYLSKTRSLVETNGLALAVAEYMLDHPRIMRDYVKATEKGRDYLRKELDRLGMRWHGGDFTNAMLVFLRDNDSVKELVGFLKARKIYIRAAFEKPLDRCVRITLGPKEAMRPLLAELKRWARAKPDRIRG